MTETVRLGRIAGIGVGMNWSVLAIFGLIVFGLSAERFPDAYPGRPEAAYWIAGVIAAVVFFGSLLAHEMAHAVVARRDGLTVEGITLWLFGGVARISGEARSPGSELRISAVGPAVSLLLGVAFGALTAGLLVAGAGGLVVATVAWLAGINILLALFNIIPAAPLDGGRLLRAFLWWRSGDPVRASSRASRVGQGFGWLLVVGALTALLAGAGLGTVWLALIGWFLATAATAEHRQASRRAALGGLSAAAVMTPEPVTLPARMSVAEFLDGAASGPRHSTFPVVSTDGAVTGLVTFEGATAVADEHRGSTTLGAIAVPLREVATVGPRDPVSELLARASVGAQGRSLVFHDQRLVGIIAPSDLARALSRTDPQAPSARRG